MRSALIGSSRTPFGKIFIVGTENELAEWLEYGWLRSHKTSRKEISDLLRITDRDLLDAAGDISADWRFGIAYNAALKLCTILLYAEGSRPEKSLHHYRTLQALPLILGSHHEVDANYLDTCRNKRNIVEYDYAGRVTEEDVAELNNLGQQGVQWLI